MTDYKLLSDLCDKCGNEFYGLVDCFIKDIQHLEMKVVYLRYLLCRMLPESDAEVLRSEIFSGLSGNYFDQFAYHQYVLKYKDGQDPMETEEYCERLKRVSCGVESVDL